MGDKPAILGQITITDADKWIDFHEDGDDWITSIATGVYADINAVILSIEAAMEAVAGVSTVSSNVAIHQPDCINSYLASTRALAFELHWKTGVHGLDNDNNHIGHVLGFLPVDHVGETEYWSSLQAQQCWVSTRAPKADSYPQPEHVGSELKRTLSGKHSKRLHVAVRHERRVSFPVLIPEIVYADQATGLKLNRDFETLWENLITGKSFRYCPDRDDLTTYDTYYLDKPDKWMDAVTRHRGGVRRHDFELSMVKQEV